MLSAFSVEHCPPSRWNTVRHQHGIVSAIAWNTHEVALHPADLGLTLRQGQALELLLQGLANKQIAAALNLSEHTVKDHVAAILERLGARNRVEAIARLRGVRLELPY